MKFVFRISVGGWGRSIKFCDPVEDSNTSSPSSINVSMEYVFGFQYWYCELCGENQCRKHCFVNFSSLEVLASSVDEGWWGWAKVLFRANWNCIFFQPDFSRSKKHDIFWHVDRLDISTFCFYESLLFQIFFLWKFIKTSVFPCLLSLLQSTATQITFSINIFICFKYYTVWNQFL